MSSNASGGDGLSEIVAAVTEQTPRVSFTKSRVRYLAPRS